MEFSLGLGSEDNPRKSWKMTCSVSDDADRDRAEVAKNVIHGDGLLQNQF